MWGRAHVCVFGGGERVARRSFSFFIFLFAFGTFVIKLSHFCLKKKLVPPCGLLYKEDSGFGILGEGEEKKKKKKGAEEKIGWERGRPERTGRFFLECD